MATILAIRWDHGEWVLLQHILLAFALSYVVGFERQLRGAPAGDRTYALVGTTAGAITAVALGPSPQTVAGVVTGIGFVGAGMVFRDQGHIVRGVTSAATLLAVVAIGIVAGAGHSVLAVLVAVLVLLDLEVRNVPFLRWLDAGRYTDRFTSDDDPDSGD